MLTRLIQLQNEYDDSFNEAKDQNDEDKQLMWVMKIACLEVIADLFEYEQVDHMESVDREVEEANAIARKYNFPMAPEGEN